MQPWLRMLEIGLLCTILLGLGCVFLPGVMERGWNLLFFGAAAPPAGFPAEAQAYIRFIYAVLGAVLVGFAVALLALARGPLRQRQRWAWNAIAGSVALWFVLDVGYSLWSGFWPNALLNLVFGAALFLPLLRLRRFLA